jgi:hypothetical protein
VEEKREAAMNRRKGETDDPLVKTRSRLDMAPGTGMARTAVSAAAAAPAAADTADTAVVAAVVHRIEGRLRRDFRTRSCASEAATTPLLLLATQASSAPRNTGIMKRIMG